MAGLTTTGLTIKTVEEILADMVADQLAKIDAKLNTEADSVLGQLNGIYAAALFELWELFEDIYQASSLENASGQALSNLAAITGTIREPATQATWTVRFTGTAAASVPAGTLFYVDGTPDLLWATDAAATVGGGGTVDVAATAVTPGTATTGFDTDSLTMPNPPASITAVAPISGTDYTTGQDEETDAQLRVRRNEELARPGSATVEAIRVDMLGVTGVDKASVFENRTAVTDSDGLPPYSIEVLVYSENTPAFDAQDVVDQIWLSKPAGTQTYGLSSGTVEDSSGGTHTVFYSTPNVVDVWVTATLDFDNDVYAGDAAAEQVLATWFANNLTLGTDVQASDVIAVLMGINGVRRVNVDEVFCEDDATPATANFETNARQVANVPLANITVTGTATTV